MPSISPKSCNVSDLRENASGEMDPNDVVARRILVEGDVDGGYYRSCVRNEAGRFRRLYGTMSPPDGSRKGEIYVEVSCERNSRTVSSSFF